MGSEQYSHGGMFSLSVMKPSVSHVHGESPKPLAASVVNDFQFILVNSFVLSLVVGDLCKPESSRGSLLALHLQ